MATMLRQMANMIDDDQMWMQEIHVDVQHDIRQCTDYRGYTKSFHTGHSMATIKIELRAPLNVARQFQEPAQLGSTQRLLPP